MPEAVVHSPFLLPSHPTLCLFASNYLKHTIVTKVINKPGLIDRE